LDLLRRRHADDSLVNPLAHLITGEKIIAQRQSHAPFSSRDDSGLIDLEIARLNQKREKVLWNGSSSSEPLEVLHLAQAFNGGLKINSRAETTLPNLFAAGEVAAGPHGADRIGGCMLTATQVFGARAGQAAALRAKRIKTIPRLARPPELRMLMTQKKILPKNPVAKILFSARKKFSQEVMILRNKPGLSACLTLFTTNLNEINELKADPFTKIKTCQALLVMEAVTRAALARTTSLGPHFRIDSNRLDSLPQS
jgi:L-aspartate oxidase